MNVSNKIIRLLKKEKLNIFESIEVLRDIESAFIEHLEENLNKTNHNQQRSGLNQHTAGGHDTQRASTPNRKINSGFEGTGKPSKKSSADTFNHEKRKGCGKKLNIPFDSDNQYNGCGSFTCGEGILCSDCSTNVQEASK